MEPPRARAASERHRLEEGAAAEVAEEVAQAREGAEAVAAGAAALGAEAAPLGAEAGPPAEAWTWRMSLG